MEEYDSLPQYLKNILDSFDEDLDPIKECERLLKECEAVGWTFEYGLDAVPFDFSRIWDVIEFRDKEYRVRTFEVKNKDEGVGGVYCIAEEDLWDVLEEADDVEAINIDCSIYFYVPVGVLALDAKEICAKHLDMPFELVSEITW